MLIFPKSFWQLPFAGALIFHAKVMKCCQLCGINACDTKNANQGYQHWFNQLAFLCESCQNSIIWQQSHFQIPLSSSQNLSGVASVFYEYPFNQIITDFKNHHHLNQMILLIHAMRQLDVPTDCTADNSVIVIVPTTKKRLSKRGFDPLYWLSLYLSFHWQIPIFYGLQREDRQHQQGLNRDERLKNVQNAFSFTALPDAKNLIFFDDVVTTGATLQAVISSLAIQAKQQQNPIKYKLFARAILHG